MTKLSEPARIAIGDEFRLRFLALALEAFRREEISRGKVMELAAMVECAADDVDLLIEDVGLVEATAPYAEGA